MFIECLRHARYAIVLVALPTGCFAASQSSYWVPYRVGDDARVLAVFSPTEEIPSSKGLCAATDREVLVTAEALPNGGPHVFEAASDSDRSVVQFYACRHVQLEPYPAFPFDRNGVIDNQIRLGVFSRRGGVYVEDASYVVHYDTLGRGAICASTNSGVLRLTGLSLTPIEYSDEYDVELANRTWAQRNFFVSDPCYSVIGSVAHLSSGVYLQDVLEAWIAPVESIDTE